MKFLIILMIIFLHFQTFYFLKIDSFLQFDLNYGETIRMLSQKSQNDTLAIKANTESSSC